MLFTFSLLDNSCQAITSSQSVILILIMSKGMEIARRLIESPLDIVMVHLTVKKTVLVTCLIAQLLAEDVKSKLGY